ncbi:MAG: hypothetical protein HN948_10145 [Clostridia bacterium]|jgi:hypothetical protein|nr:hypothetical protein [Clostridia bacterium]MBT7123354.1 hypothetical protein [Clostridia bacterium]
MNTVEEYINPCRRRIVTRYNSLPEEKQKQIENIDKLPKDKIYLKPIKRKRKPEIHEGTIFAVKLPEDVFFFGKVICLNHNLPNIDKSFFVVFFFRHGSRSLDNYPTKLTKDNILIGPMMFGDGLWRNGTCYTVGFQPLTRYERKVNYGFYKHNILGGGKVIDVNGKLLKKEPIYLDFCAYTTIHGIESDFRREIIIDPSLISDVE